MKIKTKIHKKIIKIESDKCFICGKPFDDNTHLKTKHHAVPQRLNPKGNVLVPVCRECHRKENETENIHRRYFNALRATIERMGVHIDSVENNK